MLAKKSINRILSFGKNLSIEDIALIQSAYSLNDFETIKRISKSKAKLQSLDINEKQKAIRSLKAIGRLANQYIRILNTTTAQETKIIQSEYPTFKSNNYHHNLLVFHNIRKKLKKPKRKIKKFDYFKSDFQYYYPNINSYDKFLQSINFFEYHINDNPKTRALRIVAKYSNNSDFQYISSAVLTSKTEIINYIKSLEMILRDNNKIKYDIYYDYQLIEIQMYVYINKPFNPELSIPQLPLIRE